MKLHLATALGALLLCLAGPALGQAPKGYADPRPGPGPLHKIIDLSINKRVSGAVVAGQTATFMLDVTNSGNAVVNGGMGIQVVDTLPNGFTGPLTGSGSGWFCNVAGTSLICTWNGGAILPGAPFPSITMTAVAGDREAFENCARVRISKAQDVRPANDVDCVTGRIEKPHGGRYNVGIRKDGPATVGQGQTGTFTLQVTNHGPAPVNAAVVLTVSDLVPAAFANVQASGVGWSCTVSNGQPAQVTCTYVGATVGVGQQFPVITITGRADKTGPYLNCADTQFRKAEDAKPDDNRDCAEGRVTEGGAGYDVGIRKAYKPSSEPGGPATFVLYPTNNGPSAVSAASGVQVTDTLPANFQPPITGYGTNWSCSTTGGGPWTLVCDYIGPSVGPGPLPEIEISAAVREPGKFTNCADIRLRKDRDLNPRDNRGCVTGEVSGPSGKKPDIDISKTALEQPWSWPAGTGVYRFKISNTGDTAVPVGHTFTLTENMPAGMVMISMPNAWTCSPGPGTVGPATITCTYVSTAALNPGAFIQFDMTVGFNGKKEPRYQNCASVAVSGKDGPWREANLANNRDCEPAEVVGGGGYFDIGIDKTGPSTLTLGQTGTYTLSVINASSTPLDLNTYNPPPFVTVYTPVITVTDTLPAIFIPPVSVSGGPNWTCSATGLTISCTYIGGGVIPAGGLLPPITVSATVGKAGSTQNCATASLGGAWFIADMTPANNSDCVPVTVRPPAPANDIQIQKEANSPTTVGQPMTFVLYPTNLGPGSVGAGSGIVVTDVIPGLFVPPVTINAPGWTCQPTGLTVSCSYTGTGTFAPGAGLPPIFLSAVATSAGQTQNCTQVAMPGDTQAANNQACVPVVVTAPAKPVNLTAGKEAVGAWPGGGGGFWFRLSAKNASTNAIPAGTVLTIVDTLPAGMRLDSQVGGFTCTPIGLIGPGQVTCTLTLTAPMLPGAMEIADLRVSYVGAAQPGYENCITLTASVAETTLGDNSACAQAPPYPGSLTITKTVLDDCFQNGNGNDIRCTFRITITNTQGGAWTGPLQFSDSVQPQGAVTTALVGGSPAGWSCYPGPPMNCGSNGPVTIGGNSSVSVDFTLDIMSPIIPTQNCASLLLPTPAGPSCTPLGASAPPSLVIEKVVDKDCTGTTPYTGCKFMIRIFNTGGTPYTGPLTFTDTVFGPSGITIGGVSLATPLPPGWSCTGAQPATCTIGSATIPINGHVTIPVFMTINGAIPPVQNCAVLTAPVSAQSCVPMGSTHYNLGLDSNLLPAPGSGSQKEFSFWVSSSPTVISGSQLVFNGSVTTGGTLSPMLVASTGWTCSGPWTGFVCALMVTPGSFSGSLIPLRLRTTYPAMDSGLPVTFTGQIQMNGNLDTVPSNDTRTVNTVLP